MIVVAGTLDAEATIGQYELGCDTINLPQWILNKIYPITSSFVSYGEFKTTTSGYLPTSNAFNIYLNKSDNKLTVNTLYGVTIGASNEYFRIQFDLLIDNE